MILFDCSSFQTEKPMDRALQWFLYYEPKGGHQIKIMVGSSVCGEVVFMSPTIGTSTPRTGDSAIEAHMIGEYGPFSLLLPMQDFGLWAQKVNSYDFSGDDLIRLKKGEPLRCGLIHLLSGTSKLVSLVKKKELLLQGIPASLLLRCMLIKLFELFALFKFLSFSKNIANT